MLEAMIQELCRAAGLAPRDVFHIELTVDYVKFHRYHWRLDGRVTRAGFEPLTTTVCVPLHPRRAARRAAALRVLREWMQERTAIVGRTDA